MINMKVTIIPIVIGTLGTIPRSLVKELEELKKRKSSLGHPNYSIVKLGQNTEKSPGNLRRLAVTQTPVKDLQLTLELKTYKQ